MEVKIVNEEKNLLEVECDNPTVVEALRVYLNGLEGVSFSAWRREHPSKPILFRIETDGKNPKKAVSEAVSAIKKELGVFEKIGKKSK